MPEIHPTAIVDKNAAIHDDAVIGPFCVVGPHVAIGANTRLVSHVCVMNRTTLGQDNVVWPQATLGADPQDLKFYGEDTELLIGDFNQIRENVTCHIGTENGGGKTTIGDHNLVMAGVHVAHDCHVADHCILANNVMLAGHVSIEEHAVISGGAAITHYVTIGKYTFIGGLAGVVHDCPPFMVCDGHPSRVRGVNTIGLKRHRFPDETMARLKTAYRMLFRGHQNGEAEPLCGATMSESIERLEQEFSDDECISMLTSFVRRTAIGVHGRYREIVRNDNKWNSPSQ